MEKKNYAITSFLLYTLGKSLVGSHLVK